MTVPIRGNDNSFQSWRLSRRTIDIFPFPQSKRRPKETERRKERERKTSANAEMRWIRANRSQERNDEVTRGSEEGRRDKKVGPVRGPRRAKHSGGAWVERRTVTSRIALDLPRGRMKKEREKKAFTSIWWKKKKKTGGVGEKSDDLSKIGSGAYNF